MTLWATVEGDISGFDFKEHKDNLDAYFSSKKRSGGGECRISFPSPRRLKLEFSKPEVEARVIGKTHYMPGSLGKVKLLVTTKESLVAISGNDEVLDNTADLLIYDYRDDGRGTIAGLIIDFIDDELGYKCLTDEEEAFSDGRMILRFYKQDALTIAEKDEYEIDELDEISFKVQLVQETPGYDRRVQIVAESPVHTVRLKKALIKNTGHDDIICRDISDGMQIRFLITTAEPSVAETLLDQRELQVGKITCHISPLPQNFISPEVPAPPSRSVSAHSIGSTQSGSTPSPSAPASAIPSSISIQSNESSTSVNQLRTTSDSPRAFKPIKSANDSLPLLSTPQNKSQQPDTPITLLVMCLPPLRLKLLKQFLLQKSKVVGNLKEIMESDVGKGIFKVTIQHLVDIEQLLEAKLEHPNGAIIKFYPDVATLMTYNADNVTSLNCSLSPVFNEHFNTVEISRLESEPPEDQHDMNVVFLNEYRLIKETKISWQLAYIQSENVFLYDVDRQEAIDWIRESGTLTHCLIRNDGETRVTITPKLSDLTLKMYSIDGAMSKNQLKKYFSKPEGKYSSQSIILKDKTCQLEFPSFKELRQVIMDSKDGCHTLKSGTIVKVDDGSSFSELNLPDETRQTESETHSVASWSARDSKPQATPKMVHSFQSSRPSRITQKPVPAPVHHSPTPAQYSSSLSQPKSARERTQNQEEYSVLLLSNLNDMEQKTVAFFIKSVSGRWPRSTQMSPKQDSAVIEFDECYSRDEFARWQLNLKNSRLLNSSIKLSSLQETSYLQILSTNNSDALQSMLDLYFENLLKLGLNNPVKIDNRRTYWILVTATIQDAKTLLSRNHTLPHIGRIQLIKFYERLGPCDNSSMVRLGNVQGVIHRAVESSVNADSHVIIGNCAGLTKELIKSFFSNCNRSGGGPIKRLSQLPNNQFEILYERADGASQVYRLYSSDAEQFKIKGQQLKVELVTPKLDAEFHDIQKLRVGDIPDEVTKEHLVCYLTSLTGVRITDIYFNQSGERAEITFEQTYDFSLLSELVRELKVIEGRILSIRQTSKLDALLLTALIGIPDKHFPDTASMQLESLVSGSSIKLEQTRDMKKFITRCEEPEHLVELWSNNGSKLILVDGVTCKLSPFSDWLGLDVDQDKTQVGSLTFSLNDMVANIEKYTFLTTIQKARTWLEKKLSNMRLIINDDVIQVPENLTAAEKKEVSMACKELPQKVSTWMKEIDSVTNMLVSTSMLDKVKSSCENNNALLIISNEKEARDYIGISVVGFNKEFRNIKSSIEQETRELAALKAMKDDYIPNVKRHQILYMWNTGFFDQLKQKHKAKEISGDAKAETVHVVVAAEKWKTVFEEINDLVKSLKAASSGRKPEPLIVMLNTQAEVQNYVESRLKEQRIVATWEVEEGIITAYSNSQANAAKCLKVIEECLCDDLKQLDSSQRDVLTGADWHKFSENFNKEELQKVLPCQNDLKIFSFIKRQEKVIAQLDQFFDAHAQKEIEFNGDFNAVRCLLEYGRDRFLKQVNGCGGTYAISENSIKFKGPREAVADMLTKTQDLAKSVKRDKIPLDFAPLRKYIESNSTKLEEYGQLTQSIIILSTQLKPIIEVHRPAVPERGPDEITLYNTTIKGLNIDVIRGDITQMRVDAIVNAANEDLVLGGGVAGAIQEKGGPTIQKECSRIVRNQGRVITGCCEVTTAGNLPCKSIIHAVGPRLNYGRNPTDDEANELFGCVFESVKKADEKGYISMAVPAISCGVFGYPEKKAAEIMMNVIRETAGTTSLKKLILIELTNNTILDEWISGLKQLTQPPTPSDRSSAPQNFQKIDEQAPGAATPPQSSAPNTVNFANGAKLRLVIGELATVTVDAMLNSVGADVNVSNGQVSKSLLQVIGHQLIQATQNVGPVTAGDFKTTSGFNLCKQIYHCVTPGYRDTTSEQTLMKMIENVLTSISGSGYQTVAMPVLGTGNLNYDPQIATRCMVDGVTSFFTNNPNTSINDVQIVVYHKDVNTKQGAEAVMGQKTGVTSTLRPSASGFSLQEDPDRQKNRSRTTNSETSKSRAIMINNTALCLEEGDITTTDAEAIVNSVSNKINFDGAAGKSLAAKMDREMVRQITGAVVDEVTITPCTGQLKAAHLVHINSNHPKGDNGWINLIKKVFKKCDHKNISSIALPAIGTGNLGNTPSDMAKRILKAAVGYLKDHPGTGIRSIKVVIFQKDMLREFEKALHDAMKKDESFWQFVTRRYIKPLIDTVFGAGAVGISEEPYNPNQTEQDNGGDVALIVYSLTNRGKEKVKLKLDELEKEKIRTWIFTEDMPEEKEILRKLTADQRYELERHSTRAGVNCQVVTKGASITNIKLHGLYDDVSTIERFIRLELRTVRSTAERRDRAELLAKSTQWEIEETPEIWKYIGHDLSMELEEAHSKNPSAQTSIHRSGYKQFTADLMKGTITSVDGTCKIRRVDKTQQIKETLPKTWKDMNDQPYLEVDLQQGSPEYQDVCQKFQSSLKRQAAIHNIKRIQNYPQHSQFVTEQEKVAKQLKQSADSITKTPVWHGSDMDSLNKICRNNFNRSYAGRNATAYGHGTYFARDASYSDGYCHPDPQGKKHMIMAKIVVGEFVVGNSSMKAAPTKPDNITPYNSTVDNVANPSIYVVYPDPAAYPEYEITFT